VSLGYRYLETDVHRTADGVLVAFHDRSLQRIANDTREIGQVGWDELSEIEFDGHTIPRLDQLLQRFPQARFNIDPKTDNAVEPLATVIRDLDALDRVCVGAFSDARIAHAKALLGPRLCTSPGPRSTISAILPWPLPGEHPCVSLPNTFGNYHLGPRLVRRLQNQGYRVHVWTINDEAEMHRLIDLGVDGIMTDECALLKRVLLSRGLWI
jgi:glycerophosphoryl diester phosphodiesterase